MTSSPALTIIVPVHNRRDIVGRCLDSIRAQTWRPLRLVVVDNASTDGTPGMVKDWAARNSTHDFLVDVITESVPGAAAARNAGLATVTSPWTMFFDSDDTMRPGHVAKAMQTVAAHPDADVVGWPITLHALDGSCSTKQFAVRRTVERCILDGTMATQRYMARTDVFRRAGCWRADVMAWNDIELGVRILLLPDVRVVLRPGESTVDVWATERSITGTSYAANSPRLLHSVDVIESNLPPRLAPLANLKRVMLASLCYREGYSDVAAGIYMRAMEGESASLWRRFLLSLAYRYSRSGGRGAARILYPFFTSRP